VRKNFKSELALTTEAFIKKGKKSLIANFEANELSQTILTWLKYETD